MTEIAIVGAGIGGLAAALALGRRGRRVVVYERDPAPVPASPEEMWSAWPRPGTPHARLGHAFLPGFHALLQRRAPDVLEDLRGAGALFHDRSRDLPGARRPEDAELVSIRARRAVMEGYLRRAVEAEPTVELRAGCGVAGLLAEAPTAGGLPRVVGVRLRGGGEIGAESVVVAGGRRTPVQLWLAAIGARPAAEESEGCGFQWYTRFFRLHPRAGEDATVVATMRAMVIVDCAT